MEDEATQGLARARAEVVHELATVWQVMSAGLHGLRGHVPDPEQVLFDDMLEADVRGRALFETLRRLL